MSIYLYLTKRKIMSKFEKAFWGFLAIAEVAVVAFWVAGFKDKLDVATIAFCIAGGCCAAALGALGLKKLREHYAK